MRTARYVVPSVAALVLVLVTFAPGQTATTVTPTWPTWPTGTVTVNGVRAVTGTVPDGQATTVVLQQQVSGGWRDVTSDKPDAAGRFSLSVPTWWLGTRDYRVVADSNQESAPVTFNVKPAYTPPGRAAEYEFLVKSPIARWDPCGVIGWRINTRQSTSGALRDARIAFHRLSQATGFTFRYRGTTTRIPQMDSNSWFPSHTQIVVAWARKGQSSLFEYSPRADAVGVPYYYMGYHNGDGSDAYRIATGSVVIDSQLRVKGGYGRGVSRGDILLHELGHVMGLGHVDAGSEMMNAVMTRGAAVYGKGDLAGLEARGAEMGCLYSGNP